MLYCVIIDDESSGIKSLELLIKKFCTDLKVVATSIDSVSGVDIINNYRPDIVFLDINMPNLNGFELLKKLEFKNFHLIFTTAHREYALQAIKQSAIDYLLKPVDPDDIRMAVEKVKNIIKEQKAGPDVLKILKEIEDTREIKITLPVKNGIEYIPVKEVLYIEARSNNSLVVLVNNKSVTVAKALKEFETQICKAELPFIRIQNSFIINMNYVTRFVKEDGGYAVMQDKKNIPISKNKKDEFLKWINLHPDQA
jgi:two-component system LytT family response regulator